MLTQMQSNYVRKMVFNANHVTDTLFCQDNLKFSKKLRKAPVLPNRNDDIILIYDSTVFGSAKEGAVFYPELVVSKDILESPKKIEYQNISEISLKINKDSVKLIAKDIFDNEHELWGEVGFKNKNAILISNGIIEMINFFSGCDFSTLTLDMLTSVKGAVQTANSSAKNMRIAPQSNNVQANISASSQRPVAPPVQKTPSFIFPRNGKKVFLCFEEKNRNLAILLGNTLRMQNVICFIEPMVTRGSEDRILRELFGCSTFVILYSPDITEYRRCNIKIRKTFEKGVDTVVLLNKNDVLSAEFRARPYPVITYQNNILECCYQLIPYLQRKIMEG